MTSHHEQVRFVWRHAHCCLQSKPADSQPTGSADFTMWAKLTAMAPNATHAVTCLRTSMHQLTHRHNVPEVMQAALHPAAAGSACQMTMVTRAYGTEPLGQAPSTVLAPSWVPFAAALPKGAGPQCRCQLQWEARFTQVSIAASST